MDGPRGDVIKQLGITFFHEVHGVRVLIFMDGCSLIMPVVKNRRAANTFARIFFNSAQCEN